MLGEMAGAQQLGIADVCVQTLAQWKGPLRALQPELCTLRTFALLATTMLTLFQAFTLASGLHRLHPSQPRTRSTEIVA